MAFAFDKILNAAHKDKSIQEILDLSPAALKGVSADDALKLKQAFGIDTIRDMGTNKFFIAARNLSRQDRNDEYDEGPNDFWIQELATLPDDYYVNHPSGRFRVHFGGVPYRGNLKDSARVIVVGQDPSTDESLARRAFVGNAGQRLQKLLHKIGITRSYIIINTFAYSINGQADHEMEVIAQEPIIKNFRENLLAALIERNPIEAVITLGRGARLALDSWANPENIPIFNLHHPSARQNLVSNWNSHLPNLIASITPDDPTAVDPIPYTGDWNADTHRMDIPRYDLPYNLPSWHGTNGTNSQRGPNRTTEITWTSIL